MKISKILERNKPSISFEVFPPKRHDLQNEMSDGSFKEMNHVKGVINKLSKLNPSYISVTYGAAGGNTGANTAEIAGYVENDCGITALAHLTCLISGADIISSEIEILREKGAPKVSIADLCRDDMAEAVEDAFRMSKLVVAAASYDADVFPPMHDFLHHLKLKAYQKRRVGIIENGSWAPCAGRIMKGMLETMKEIEIVEENRMPAGKA